jgi:hypothetical protein
MHPHAVGLPSPQHLLQRFPQGLRTPSTSGLFGLSGKATNISRPTTSDRVQPTVARQASLISQMTDSVSKTTHGVGNTANTPA